LDLRFGAGGRSTPCPCQIDRFSRIQSGSARPKLGHLVEPEQGFGVGVRRGDTEFLYENAAIDLTRD